MVGCDGFAPVDWPARMVALPFLILQILTLAALSRRWIEEPMISWGRRLAYVGQREVARLD